MKQLQVLQLRWQCWAQVQIPCTHSPLALRSCTAWLAPTWANCQDWVAEGRLPTGYASALLWMTEQAGALPKDSNRLKQAKLFSWNILRVAKARMIIFSCQEVFSAYLNLLIQVYLERLTEAQLHRHRGLASLTVKHVLEASYKLLKLLYGSNLEQPFITQNI